MFSGDDSADQKEGQKELDHARIPNSFRGHRGGVDTKVKTTLSQGSITFPFFSGLLLGGAITTIALLGSQIPLKCFDAGNAADWLAAIGTWVIGAGAMKIAYDANAKRKQDVEAENLAELQRREIALRLVGTDALTAQMFERNLNSEFDDEGNVDFADIRLFFEIAQKKLGAIRWDSEHKASLRLGAGGLEAMLRTEHHLLAVLDFCERFLSKYPAGLRSYDPEKCQLMEWMRESASDLTKAGEDLEKAVRRDLFGEEVGGRDDPHG